MAKTGFKEQAFFFDPTVWTKRKAWAWAGRRGHDAKKAKPETKRFKGRGRWFGWGVRPVPKGKEGRLRWIPFGDSIMVRFIAPGKAPKKKKKTKRRNKASNLERASRGRAKFLDDGRTWDQLPLNEMPVQTLKIPADGLVLLGNHRQINYATDKFGNGWIEYHHRAEGGPKVGRRLKDTDWGRSFIHPDGAYIVVFPGPAQDFKFEYDERGLLN